MQPDNSRLSHKGKKKKCPFIGSPDKDCYCLDMNSNKISMALFYCQNHYTQCVIYKQLKSKQSPDKDPMS
jgi:hypothetical protein